MLIPCKLVHHTGTMIRFRPAQMAQLPANAADIALLLPSGQEVAAYFNPNPRNPNVSGAALVRYIKRRIGFGETEDVLVEVRGLNVWVVHLLNKALAIATDAGVPARQLPRGVLEAMDVATLVQLADREADRGRRIGTYRRIIRPSCLNRLMVSLVGPRCQIRGCDAAERIGADWGIAGQASIVEVHHIEEMARVVDHHPRNLCVVCANHHRLIHGLGDWRVTHDGTDVVLASAGRDLFIERAHEVFQVN